MRITRPRKILSKLLLIGMALQLVSFFPLDATASGTELLSSPQNPLLQPSAYTSEQLERPDRTDRTWTAENTVTGSSYSPVTPEFEQPALDSQGALWPVPGHLQPDLELEHPRVFYNPDNLDIARLNLEGEAEWARQVESNLLAQLHQEPWFSLEEADLRSLIPEAGSYYTYMATNICPDGTRMTPIGWSAPGQVRCASGLILPNDDYPDDGQGWVDERGQRYYFAARWNGFVIQEIERALPRLAYAYAFTEDPIYAEKAALFLDELSAIYPAAIEGPLDYPGLAPGKEGGRLQRPKYQVARSLVEFVEAVDLLWNSEAFNEPSQTVPGVTVKENTVYNLLLNAADYCYRESQLSGFVDQLHNGTADYNMGLLAVGSLLGIESYVNWAWDGPTSIQKMMSNNIDRDGNYFETAASYSQAAQDIYIKMAEMLYYVRTPSLPNGVRLYDDPRFEKFYVDYWERNSIAGRLALYGDSNVDNKTDTVTEFNPLAFSMLLKFYVRAADPLKKAEYADKLHQMAQGDANLKLTTPWSVFHLSGINEGDPSAPAAVRASEWFGGKGLVFLRTGEDENKRGAFLRYGASLNHGQYDQLGILIYDQGRELSFDPGYGSAHYRVGWQYQPVAHLTTVVNEKTQLSAASAGGSMNFFAEGPGVRVVDVSDESAYAHEDVNLYRRLLAVVDSSESSSYLIDIFRVNGGSVRDYSFHSRGNQFETAGLELSQPRSGSVASARYDWGDKIREDGFITGFENQNYYFNPPPANGYGFLGNPRYAQANGQWSASWSSPQARLKLTMLPQEDREVITARGPLPMENGVPYLLARDKGLAASQYVSVIETGPPSMQPRDIKPLAVSGHPGGPLAPVALTVSDGEATDYFLSTVDGYTFQAADEDNEQLSTDAEWAVVRSRDGVVTSLQLTKGTHLSIGDLAITGAPAQLSGTILEVNDEQHSLLVQSAADLVDSAYLIGRQILFDSPEYSRNSPYTIERIEREGAHYRLYFEPGSFLLATGLVKGVPSGQVLPNGVNLPYSRNVARLGPNDYFTGKRVVSENGAVAEIQEVLADYAGLKVDSVSGFADGDELFIYDIKPGDHFTIPVSIRLDRRDDGSYAVDSPVPVTVINGPREYLLNSREGDGWAITGRSPAVPLTFQPDSFSLRGTEPGAYVTVGFEVPADARYEVRISGKQTGNGGLAAVKLNDMEAGQYDFYAETNILGPEISLGTFDLTEGKHELTWEGIGKSAAASGYHLHPASIRLVYKGEIEQELLVLLADSYNVYEGMEAQLSLGWNRDWTGSHVMYSSSDPALAQVDANGKVTAVAPGEVTLSAVVVLAGITRTAELTLNIMKEPIGEVHEFRLFPDVFHELDPEQWSWVVAEVAQGTTYNRQNSYGTLYLSSKIGDYIAFDLHVPEEGNYRLAFKGYVAPYGAISEILLNGQPIGQYDFYRPTAGHGEFVNLSDHYFAEGVHRFVFRVVGRNPASTNYGTYISDLRFTRLNGVH
ncbi:Ig-like domain-containing protein [Paenibacillus senegalensis]|uniref:Ig-like domain-containing protein n=1 Tax=Paenibacillus senegalensis TaxID=1465766 RepID=UPI0002898803|nr:Ig-like domain-containing protein [Paenibacillus senegalensis]